MKRPLVIVLLTSFLILAVAVAGCTSPSPPATPSSSETPVPAASQVPEKTLSTLEPVQMVLEPSELPGNYVLVNSGERNESKIKSWMLNAGWKKGNYVMMQKNESGASASPVIWQYIYKFPVENASQVVSLLADGLVVHDAHDESNQNYTYTELAAPGIGNTSRAVSIAEKNGSETMTVIVFSKYDVYEELWSNATPVDYENLKNVAAIAAAKIR